MQPEVAGPPSELRVERSRYHLARPVSFTGIEESEDFTRVDRYVYRRDTSQGT